MIVNLLNAGLFIVTLDKALTMRRYIILLMIFIHSNTSAQIQEFGLKLGISNTKFSISSKTDNFNYEGKYAQSLYALIYKKIYKYNNISLNAGLGYIDKVSLFDFKVRVPNTNDSIVIREYRSLPAAVISVDLKIALPVSGKSNVFPYLLVGPQIHINSNQFKGINSYPIKTTNFNAMLGAGVDLKLRSLLFFLEAQRFLNFNRNLSSTSGIDFSAYEKSMVFCMGIKYLIDKKP